jgi:uncharacterized protein with HEPN domain
VTRRPTRATRDRTIHRYPEVDLDVLWDIMATDLPELAAQIHAHTDPDND